MTYDPMLTKEMGLLDWSQDAQSLVNRIHGLNPWPGAVVAAPDGIIKLWRAEVVPGAGRPGEVLVASPKEGLVLAAGSQAVRILQLQAPGGKQMAAAAQSLVNRIHGLNPWPGAVVAAPDGIIKLWRAEVVPGAGRPGEVLVASPKEGLVLAAGSQAVRILQLQAPGGKQMAAADYLRGHPAQVGDVWQTPNN